MSFSMKLPLCHCQCINRLYVPIMLIYIFSLTLRTYSIVANPGSRSAVVVATATATSMQFMYFQS